MLPNEPLKQNGAPPTTFGVASTGVRTGLTLETCSTGVVADFGIEIEAAAPGLTRKMRRASAPRIGVSLNLELFRNILSSGEIPEPGIVRTVRPFSFLRIEFPLHIERSAQEATQRGMRKLGG
jgi:hypothetical protein